MLFTCIFLCERCCLRFLETVGPNDKVPVFDKTGRVKRWKGVRCPRCRSKKVVYVETYSVG